MSSMNVIKFNMSEEVLRNYSNSIKKLKLESQQCGITDEEFKEMYLDCLQDLQTKKTPKQSSKFNVFFYIKIIISITIAITLIYNVKNIYSCVICSLQEYIYPGLRLLRYFSIPFISLFPSLTGKFKMVKYLFLLSPNNFVRCS